MAGKLLVGEPNDDDTAIKTAYFRLSGAFSMEISDDGFQMFVDAELTIGPPDVNLLNMTAIGLIIVNDTGLAINLELQNELDLGPVMDVNFKFFLILNTTSIDQQYNVPAIFMSNGYLSQNFIDTYIQFWPWRQDWRCTAGC